MDAHIKSNNDSNKGFILPKPTKFFSKIVTNINKVTTEKASIRSLTEVLLRVVWSIQRHAVSLIFEIWFCEY